jgi:phosphopantetheinyl transferase
MSEVILAYSRLRRQLPARLRARWRARLAPARALRLSAEPHAQSRSLLGIALACRLLGAASGTRVEPRQLRYTPLGKPHAPGLPEFSIAHSGEWVVCALARAGAIGVDIEPVVPRGALPAWRGVFDAREQAAASTPRRALAIWTAKEAALKAAGAGFAELPRVQVRPRVLRFRGRRWQRRAPRIAPGLVACVVTSRAVKRLRAIAVPAALALRP